MNTIEKLKEQARRLAVRLAEPGTVFYTLPLLMLLLVAGTIAQRYLGLYDAQRLFFSSFVLWLGPVPLPGGYSLTGFISLSLLIKFLFFSDWRLKKAGINLAHLGILVLLIGGLFTALQAKEGFIVIPEGEQADIISDYHQRELVIRKNGALQTIIPHKQIKAGRALPLGTLPFVMEVRQACRNCKIKPRDSAQDGFHDMAQFMALDPAPPAKEDEANLYGATLALSGAGPEQDGTYIIFDAMPKPIRLETGQDVYEIIYQKQQRALPFTLMLKDFEKQHYPGTNTARTYHSDIIVRDNGVEWPARIEMNKPLRYKNYTIFQSSFIETPQETATVLTVVKNSGWLFPYIGTALIALGLLLHTLITSGMRIKTS